MNKKNYEIKAFDPSDPSISTIYYVENVDLNKEPHRVKVFERLSQEFAQTFKYSEPCYFAYTEIETIPENCHKISVKTMADRTKTNR